MGGRHLIGSLILMTCLRGDVHGQPSNSPADSAVDKRALPISNESSETPHAIRETSTNFQGYLNLGFEYYGNKAFTEALVPLEKAALLEPTNYEANLYLGYAHYYLAQFNAASVCLRVAAQCRPTDAEP